MNRLYKTTILLTLFIVSIFLSMTFLLGISPGTAQAIDLINSPLPDSTPGNFKVTWYSAKRYVPGQEPGTPHAGEIFNNLIWPAVDKDKSDAALQSWDTSNCTGQGTMPDLTFDMKNWQPDPQYWITWQDLLKKGNTLPYDTMFKSLYNWNWCEIDGFIKLPDNLHLTEKDIENDRYYAFSVGIDPLQRSDVHCDLQIPYNGELRAGTFVPFRLRIQCYKPDPNNLNTPFSVTFNYSAGKRGTFDLLNEYADLSTKTGHIPTGNIYGTLALKDMQPYFQLDTKNYTIYLDPKYSAFPVKDYEYGYAGGTNFKTLALGTNYLEPDSGDVIVRYKLIDDPKWGWMYNNWYITLGTISLPAPGQLTVTRRTPTTASLSWSAPSGDAAPTTYDIYRQKVDGMSGFAPNPMFTVDNTVQKIGSTSSLNFTDQGLSYDVVYAYYIKANYSTGNSTASNTVRTDSVIMQGLPPTPGNLQVKIQNQSTLTVSWTCQRNMPEIKEYVVYRNTTYHSLTTPPTPPGGGPSNVISGIMQVTPTERGRTTATSFGDSGLYLYDQCEYSLQAVDENGIPSLISAPVSVSIPDLTPPTMPGNLQAGDVLRQGDKMQYAFPDESGIRNVVLGPKREVALHWNPSTDNVELIGYDIYRSVIGKDPVNNTYWGNQNVLVSSTKDTSFIDSGLEFGATYTYDVVAKDARNNRSWSSVYIGTEKSSLADLIIKTDNQSLTPEPAFVYYQTEYNLNVENAVKSITLTTKKIDSQAKVMVNGNSVGDDGSIGPLALDPGKNIINIEVVPRQGAQWFINPETMRYTLTVNRANIDNLPALTLPESGTVVNEGDTYRAAGRLTTSNDLVWTGTSDYGDGTGEKSLKLNADGSFGLEHTYLDNGQYKINIYFRYKDLGLVKGMVEVTVKNVAPTLTVQGIKDDEITTKDGALLTITGTIDDPGRDSWTVSGDYDSEWGAIPAAVKEDKTFIYQARFYDDNPEYDLALKGTDDDGGVFTKDIKIKVENVAPSVQAGESAMVQQGVAFTRAGSFTDPGFDTWQATVDYGDGSGSQPLTLKDNKTFDLNHTYLKTGSFTVTVGVEDQDGGAGSASFLMKVKDYLFTLEAGPDTSLKEGDKLERDVSVGGQRDKIKSITVDYGDGAGEESVVLSKTTDTQSNQINRSTDNFDTTDTQIKSTGGKGSNPIENSDSFIEPHISRHLVALGIVSDSSRADNRVIPMQIGVIPLQHIYKDNGTYTVKTKITDVDEDSYEDSFQAEVANVPPTVQLESIGNMNVGNTFTCHGSITDPGADTWTATIYFKDGSAPSKISVDSDKTFSFNHTYIISGNYNIEAVVQDDDGGIGCGRQQAIVLAPSSGGGSISDASLHSFMADGPVTLTPGFDPECQNYTIAHPGMNLFNITITVSSGATVKYTNGGAEQILPIDPNTLSATFGVDLLSNLVIKVTAQDGVTTREYTFATV